MTERFLTFDCEGDTLAAVLHEPESEPRDIGVLIVVGGPQYRVGSHRQFVLMARQLAGAGYAVMRFDYRGMGDSTGLPRTFETVDDDIRSAIDALLTELPSIRNVVGLGLCDAASAVLMYCCSDARVHGLILANPWVRTEAGHKRAQMRHYYGQRLLTRAFWDKVFSGQFRVGESVRDLMSALSQVFGTANQSPHASVTHYVDRMLEGLTQTPWPVLILMSERDLTAREFDDLCRASGAWTRQLSSPKVHRLDVLGADHTFSSTGSLESATSVMLEWLNKWQAKGLK